MSTQSNTLITMTMYPPELCVHVCVYTCVHLYTCNLEVDVQFPQSLYNLLLK